MDRLHDPAILALPYPLRVDAALGKPVEELLLHPVIPAARLRPFLLDPAMTAARLLNGIPELNRLAQAHWNSPASFNLGSFMLLLARARLRVQGDPLLEVGQGLQALLGASDLADGLPARFIRPPAPLVYIAFPRPCALQVYNLATGLHELEGAYVGSYEVPPHQLQQGQGSDALALGIVPDRPTRVIELIFTGSPIGKRDALDDASQHLTLLIQDEDECLSRVLERHVADYSRPQWRESALLSPLPIEIR